MEKDAIVAVDSDVNFLDRFKRTLDDLGLLGDYDFLPLEARGSDETEVVAYFDNILESTLAKRTVAVVLVDIVIVEQDEPPQDRSGFAIARHIQENLPGVPVIGITRFIKQARLLSEASFSPYLQGLLIKSFIESGLSRRDFFEFLRQANEKLSRSSRRAAGAAGPQSGMSCSALASRTEPGRFQVQDDPRCVLQVEQVGKDVIFGLLEALFPGGNGTISYLRPGFSGSHLFRVFIKSTPSNVSPSEPRGWVIKISSNLEKLANELERSRMIVERVPRDLYPALLKREITRVGSWGALALELEEGCQQLFDYLTVKSNVNEACELIRSCLSGFLTKHYGDSVKQQCFLWSSFYKLDTRTKAGVLTFLDECRSLGKGYAPTKQIVRRLANMIQSDGRTETALVELSANVDTRYIHGDLNSRNILVTSGQAPRLVFIDFANSGQDHYVKDLAKLEIDLIFLIMDSKSRGDTTWERTKDWTAVVSLCERGAILRKCKLASSDAEIRKTMKLVIALRENICTLGTDLDERYYCAALVHYAIKLLCFPDVTIQKKVFALRYIERLLDTIASYPA